MRALLAPRSRYLSYSISFLSALAIASLPGCGGGGGTSQTTAAAVSPHPAMLVASTTPANGASGVPFNTGVAVVFNADIDPTTLTPGTFKVGNVSGTVAYDATNKTAVFHPAGALAANTAYSVVVTTGVKSSAGAALAADYSFNFSTSSAPDVTPPTVTSVFPPNGAANVPLDTKITATFSEAMDSTELVGNTSSGVSASLGYDSATFTASMTPTTKLNANTIYFVTVKGTIRDLAGNQLGADVVWSFTTAAQ